MNKTCKRCGEEKPMGQFHDAPACRDGKRGACIACTNAQMRKHRAKPETKAKLKAYCARPDIREKERARQKSPAGRASYRRRSLASPSFALSFALYRALKRCPTENPVTHAELMQMFRDQGGRCALSGLVMTWQRGKLSPTSLSMDRIEAGGGYTRDNLRLVCHAVNMFRSNFDDETVYMMALALVANMKRPKLRLIS